MPTINEIEEKIQFHSGRLTKLLEGKNNSKNIGVATNLIEYWKNQKNQAMTICNLAAKYNCNPVQLINKYL